MKLFVTEFRTQDLFKKVTSSMSMLVAITKDSTLTWMKHISLVKVRKVQEHWLKQLTIAWWNVLLTANQVTCTNNLVTLLLITVSLWVSKLLKPIVDMEQELCSIKHQAFHIIEETKQSDLWNQDIFSLLNPWLIWVPGRMLLGMINGLLQPKMAKDLRSLSILYWLQKLDVRF